MKNLQDYYEEWKKLKEKKCLKGQDALEAVKKNGYALEHIENPSEEMCLEAVKEDGYALKFIHNPSEEVCFEAVKKDGQALKYIHNASEEMCLKAVKQTKHALQYVPEIMFDKEVQHSVTIDGVKYVRA